MEDVDWCSITYSTTLGVILVCDWPFLLSPLLSPRLDVGVLAWVAAKSALDWFRQRSRLRSPTPPRHFLMFPLLNPYFADHRTYDTSALADAAHALFPVVWVGLASVGSCLRETAWVLWVLWPLLLPGGTCGFVECVALSCQTYQRCDPTLPSPLLSISSASVPLPSLPYLHPHLSSRWRCVPPRVCVCVSVAPRPEEEDESAIPPH